jgi:2,5-diketo-D-gluconate reductase A
MTMPAVPNLRLLHGADIPQLGVGTWPMDDRDAERAVALAIEAGYRHVDTAAGYGNETGVGNALKASGVPRDELFVTSKLSKDMHGRKLAIESFEQSLSRLGVDYLDLFLIHWPNPDQDRYVETWESLVELLQDGRIKAAGVSNFKPAHLDRIIAATDVVPDVNQIQLSPAVTRDSYRAYHQAHGIVTESWSPIGGMGVKVLDDPLVNELANAMGKTPAQVVLRWHVQLGFVTIPKSANPQRLKENLDIFSFELDPEQLAALSSLNQGDSAGADSDAEGY